VFRLFAVNFVPVLLRLYYFFGGAMSEVSEVVMTVF